MFKVQSLKCDACQCLNNVDRWFLLSKGKVYIKCGRSVVVVYTERHASI